MKKFVSLMMILTILLLLVGCAAEIERIKLDEDTITLTEGETYKIEYKLKPSDAEGELEWESDDKDVAVVSRRGKITAVGAGKCTITVEAENGVDSEIEVIVEPKITEEELAIVGTYYLDHGNIMGDYYSSYDSYVPNMTMELREDKTGTIRYNGSEYRNFTWRYSSTGTDFYCIYFYATLEDGTVEYIWHYPSDREIWYSFNGEDYAIFEY